MNQWNRTITKISKLEATLRRQKMIQTVKKILRKMEGVYWLHIRLRQSGKSFIHSLFIQVHHGDDSVKYASNMLKGRTGYLKLYILENTPKDTLKDIKMAILIKMQSSKSSCFKEYVQREVFINKSLQAQEILTKVKWKATDGLLKSS